MTTPSPAPSAGSSGDRWSDTVAAACHGSRAAQGQLFADLRAYLRSQAAQILDPGLAAKVSPSDLVQETLLEAYRSFRKFQGKSRGELVVWLHGILNNQAKMTQRRYRGTEKRALHRETRLSRSGSRSGEPWAPADTAQTTPSGRAIANEQLQRLEQAVASLPPRQEQVIRLRSELRLSFDEVATVLGCSPDAAQKLWSRAIDRAAKELKK